MLFSCWCLRPVITLRVSQPRLADRSLQRANESRRPSPSGSIAQCQCQHVPKTYVTFHSEYITHGMPSSQVIDAVLFSKHWLVIRVRPMYTSDIENRQHRSILEHRHRQIADIDFVKKQSALKNCSMFCYHYYYLDVINILSEVIILIIKIIQFISNSWLIK